MRTSQVVLVVLVVLVVEASLVWASVSVAVRFQAWLYPTYDNAPPVPLQEWSSCHILAIPLRGRLYLLLRSAPSAAPFCDSSPCGRSSRATYHTAPVHCGCREPIPGHCCPYIQYIGNVCSLGAVSTRPHQRTPCRRNNRMVSEPGPHRYLLPSSFSPWL